VTHHRPSQIKCRFDAVSSAKLREIFESHIEQIRGPNGDALAKRMPAAEGPLSVHAILRLGASL